jgi:hypothetical protein
MACSGSPLLHAILEVSPRGDASVSSEGGELWLPSPEGVQHDDVRRPHRNYVATEGDPNASDCTDEAIVDHYTNTPPQATDGSPEGKMMCPTE